MRTTLDLDDALLAQAIARFPPGTPKTVVLEEALRQLLWGGPGPSARPLDPRLQRLVDAGRLEQRTGPPPPEGLGGVELSRLLADLAADRADR